MRLSSRSEAAQKICGPEVWQKGKNGGGEVFRSSIGRGEYQRPDGDSILPPGPPLAWDLRARPGAGFDLHACASARRLIQAVLKTWLASRAKTLPNRFP
jgi:hypothetical protein